MFALDFVILLILVTSALIHELSFFLLPPVVLLFFLYCRKQHRAMHFIFVSDIILIVYIVMMSRFKFSDPVIIAQSWSGIFGDPATYRYMNNDGLVIVVDQNIASKGVSILLDAFLNLPIRSLLNVFIAVAIPFIFLLISGIRIFHSSSYRSRRIRRILMIFCMSPFLLLPIAGDYGRWFSMCAVNLVTYSLLIAHSATQIQHNNGSKIVRAITSIAKQAVVICIAITLVNYRLSVFGYFEKKEDTVLEETWFMVDNFQSLTKYIKPLITRKIVIKPWWAF